MEIFPCRERFPVVIMVWVISRFRLKAHPGISSSCISPLTSSGQRSRASWASQPQKSATLSPQPGGRPRKFIRTRGGIGGKKKTFNVHTPYCHLGHAQLNNIFPRYLINGMIFKKKKLLNIRSVFWFSLQIFVWNISHSKKNWLRYNQNVNWSSCKVPIILMRF